MRSNKTVKTEVVDDGVYRRVIIGKGADTALPTCSSVTIPANWTEAFDAKIEAEIADGLSDPRPGVAEFARLADATFSAIRMLEPSRFTIRHAVTCGMHIEAMRVAKIQRLARNGKRQRERNRRVNESRVRSLDTRNERWRKLVNAELLNQRRRRQRRSVHAACLAVLAKLPKAEQPESVRTLERVVRDRL